MSRIFHKDLITICEDDNKIHIAFADNIPHKFKPNVKIYVEGELYIVTRSMKSFIRVPNYPDLSMEMYSTGIGYKVITRPNSIAYGK